MVTLAEIFRQYGPTYRTAYADNLLPSHLRVMWCIENCRTEALGGHIYQCEACGEMVYSYHSCRNRHCNQCQDDKAAAWLTEQQSLLLPVPYFLVTFTLPEVACAQPLLGTRRTPRYPLPRQVPRWAEASQPLSPGACKRLASAVGRP